jgi:hypothetical protein
MSTLQKINEDRTFLRAQLALWSVNVALEVAEPGTLNSVPELRSTFALIVTMMRKDDELRDLPEYGVGLRTARFLAGKGGAVSVSEVLRALADGEGEPSGSPENLFENTWKAVAAQVSN